MFSKLVVTKLLIRYLRTQNLYAIFVKILDICKKFGNDLVDARGNISRPGTKPRLEIVVLNLTMESLGIDCESFFFVLLQGYRKEIPKRMYTTSSTCRMSSMSFMTVPFLVTEAISEQRYNWTCLRPPI